MMFSTFVLAQSVTEEFYNADGNYYSVEKDNLAVQGFDLVEYFKSQTPTKGDSTISFQYDGIKYQFSNSENRQSFKANPEAYLPEFGGYCAFGLGVEIGEGVGDNRPGKYPINPNSFKIIDDKLYLFYDGEYFRALKKWNTDEDKFLDNANEHWKLIHPNN